MMAEGWYWVTVVGRRMAAMLWAANHRAAAVKFARHYRPAPRYAVEVDQGGRRHGKQTFWVEGRRVKG